MFRGTSFELLGPDMLFLFSVVANTSVASQISTQAQLNERVNTRYLQVFILSDVLRPRLPEIFDKYDGLEAEASKLT